MGSRVVWRKVGEILWSSLHSCQSSFAVIILELEQPAVSAFSETLMKIGIVLVHGLDSAKTDKTVIRILLGEPVRIQIGSDEKTCCI